MQKSSLPVGVKTLHKYYKESKTLDMDCPVQRAGGQWNNLSMSLLIHSMLTDYIIPNLYFRKEVKDGTSFLSVLDGKQRLSTVFSFIQDEWSLHAKTPKVVYDGTEYDIALKTFSELDEDLKSAILGYRFPAFQLENCTDDEVEETFARLNAGTPLSKIQQARPKMGMKMAEWCNGLVSQGFFQKSLNLTVPQLRREDDFLMLITGMMLLDNRCEKCFLIKTSASAAECVRFAEYMKTNYTQEKKENMELLVEYLNETFKGAEYKYLKKNNIPIVMYNAQIAIEKGISEEEYFNVVDEFYNNDCTQAYEEASGSGNVKLVNINVRLKELLSYLMQRLPQYFKDESKALADPAVETSDAVKKNEDNSDDAMSVEDSENSSEKSASADDKKYVLFKLSTDTVGQENEEVYAVDNTDEDYLDSVGYDLSKDNAESFGIEDEEQFHYSLEILDKTREEIEEEYGEVLNA